MAVTKLIHLSLFISYLQNLFYKTVVDTDLGSMHIYTVRWACYSIRFYSSHSARNNAIIPVNFLRQHLIVDITDLVCKTAY